MRVVKNDHVLTLPLTVLLSNAAIIERLDCPRHLVDIVAVEIEMADRVGERIAHLGQLRQLSGLGSAAHALHH